MNLLKEKGGFIDLEDVNLLLFSLLSVGGVVALWIGFSLAGGLGGEEAVGYPLWQKVLVSLVVIVLSYLFSRE